MNICDIQLIRIGACTSYKFDESFSLPTLFVSSEREIRTLSISKPLLLIIQTTIDIDFDLIFQIDKILYMWQTNYNHVDSIQINSNMELIKTAKINQLAIQRAQLLTPTNEFQLKPRIGVFMSDNRALEPDLQSSGYHSQVAAINYSYCLKHKYDFIYYRPYLDSKTSHSLYNCKDPHRNETRHASWSKLLSAKDMFKQSYDYIVYIDSDCIFKDFDKRIEEVCSQMFTHNIIFLNNKPWDEDKPCAGFFICKNSELARSYITDWYNVNLPEKNKVHAYEQDALWTIYKTWKLCFVMNRWMFREHHEQFLRHICHLENDLRSYYFKQFIIEHKINYNNAIFCISTKDYNTGS
jgi:hypothetical protein